MNVANDQGADLATRKKFIAFLRAFAAEPSLSARLMMLAESNLAEVLAGRGVTFDVLERSATELADSMERHLS